jgi:uncharacterized membrane protein
MQDSQEQQYSVSRLVAFSDGVFGFAITLLATSIPAPQLPSIASNQDVLSQLWNLLPNFFSYVFSFYMVGIYWAVHHRIFRYIIKIDQRLLWINITELLFIALLPFSTALVGRYGRSSVITVFYAAHLSILSLIYTFMWWYASGHHRLIAQELDAQTITREHLREFVTITLFLLSIGLAFINPQLAKIVWLAIFLIRPIIVEWYMRYKGQK